MTITYGAARQLATDLLVAAGLAVDHAETTAEAIVLADAWGIGSHGLMRLPHYLDRMAAGGYPPKAELTVAEDTGPLLVMDGGGGLGHWQLRHAADEAARRCQRFGIAAVAVGNSGHCGALGVYTLPVTDAGLMAMVFSNGPASMAPWGGHEPVLSTSPLAVGVPLRPRPVVVDMALSAVARGRVAAKAKAGEPIPAGWVVDAAGEPVTDPATALSGMLAPLGGAKGFALALCVEALTGGLIGPALSADVSDMFDPADDPTPQRIAHLVLAIDPARTDSGGSAEAAAARLDDVADRVLAAGGRLPGTGRPHPAKVPDNTVLNVDSAVLAELERRALAAPRTA